MGKNIVEKVLQAHLKEGKYVPGQEIGIRIDQTLVQDADFGSIGTNDLIARLQGEPMERDNPEISGKYTQLTPELLNYLDILVDNVAKSKKHFPLSLCGMLASSPESLLYFTYTKAVKGVEIIPSVGAAEAAYVKEFIRHIDTRHLKRIFTNPDIRYNAHALQTALAAEAERIDKEIMAESDGVLLEMVELSLTTYGAHALLSVKQPVVDMPAALDQSI